MDGPTRGASSRCGAPWAGDGSPAVAAYLGLGSPGRAALLPTATGCGLSHAMATVLPATLSGRAPDDSPPMGYLACPLASGVPHAQSWPCIWHRYPSQYPPVSAHADPVRCTIPGREAPRHRLWFRD